MNLNHRENFTPGVSRTYAVYLSPIHIELLLRALKSLNVIESTVEDFELIDLSRRLRIAKDAIKRKTLKKINQEFTRY